MNETKESLILKTLMERNDYVSGQELSKLLGISRATINRSVKRLISRGFPIEVHPRLGYRLSNLDDLSTAPRIVSMIPYKLRYNIYYVKRCSTTQEIALSLAKAGAPDGTVVLAEEMEKGRGRLGREWLAPSGGLWLSIITRPTNIENLQVMTLATGVSVAKAINSFLRLKAELKWPNDVLFDGKKVAGILTEGEIEADYIRFVVVGIGINVNNNLPAELSSQALTLKQLAGRVVPRIPLLVSILAEFERAYKMLLKGSSSAVIEEWKSLSATLGKVVKVVYGNEETVGKAVDIADDGALIIETEKGTRKRVYAGDVIHIREL